MTAQSKYRLQLDILTADILKRSAAVIQCIEENIRFTHSLRLSSSLISQLDLQIGTLNSNLESYQNYLSQLNSLLIRSEYFEAQLAIIEKEEGLSDRDNDLNWRSTEATLENLFLELRFITKKIEAVLDYPTQLRSFSRERRRDSLAGSSFKSMSTMLSRPETERKKFTYLDDEKPEISSTPEGVRSPTLQEKTDGQTLFKPIRCGSIHRSGAKRVSTDLRSFNLLTSTPVTPISTKNNRPSKQTLLSPSKSAVKHYQLATPTRTPETTVDMTFDSIFSDGQEATSKTIEDSEVFMDSKKQKHIRCVSLPISELEETEISSGENIYLRHFTSYETGLKINRVNASPDQVKDSQYVYSPVSIYLEDYLTMPIETSKPQPAKLPKQENTPDATVIDESTRAPIEDTMEDITLHIPAFEHKLNRSNSCESIFSIMTTRVHIGQSDNKSQTMSWMKQFNTAKKQITDISAVSVSNTAPSNRTDNSKAFSALASYARPSSIKPTVNRAPVKLAQPSTPSMDQELATRPLTLATSALNKFFKKPSPLLTSHTAISQTLTPELTAPTTNGKPTSTASRTAPDYVPQWTSLFSKFNPNNIIINPVISEVGKPLVSPAHAPIQSIPIKARQKTSDPMIKGSFSTLKIANGSKMIGHGQSSDLGKSLVVSSRISYGALRDALQGL